MKAIVYTEYGTPEMLRLQEVPKPVPGPNEVLVRLHAASVNSWDWDLLRGKPFMVRLWGLLKPKYQILGADVAGTVEAVGRDVTRFRPGDDVFGDLAEDGWGGFAEYVCAGENFLVAKPAGMSFEQAAAIPQAALLALQGLRRRQLQPGQKVLINGAGGGVGTFAIQLARLSGAEVTGVDHSSKLDVMRAAGADHVIDYSREDFAANGQRYDLILDVVARRSVFAYARSLAPGGFLVVVGGTTGALLQAAFLGPLAGRFGNKSMGLLMWRPSTSDLERMKELFESGEVVPVIDRSYPLAEAAEGLRHLGEGRARGKVLISIADKAEDGSTPTPLADARGGSA